MLVAMQINNNPLNPDIKCIHFSIEQFMILRMKTL